MNSPSAAQLSPMEILRGSGSNFLASFSSMNADRRRGMTAIYAFCRVADDAADACESVEEGRDHLAFWRRELELCSEGEPESKVGEALCAAIEEFDIDARHLHEVLTGVEMDLEGVSCEDLAALESYCHKVASAVGLACLPVFGVKPDPQAEIYATQLGLALQITNILRDLQVDARLGRVYVPNDALADVGIDKEWLAGSGPPSVYARGGPVDLLSRRFVEIAHERFARAAQARASLPLSDSRRLVPAEIMSAVYRELLGRVERRGGDLSIYPRVPLWRKMFLAWRVRLRGYS